MQNTKFLLRPTNQAVSGLEQAAQTHRRISFCQIQLSQEYFSCTLHRTNQFLFRRNSKTKSTDDALVVTGILPDSVLRRFHRRISSRSGDSIHVIQHHLVHMAPSLRIGPGSPGPFSFVAKIWYPITFGQFFEILPAGWVSRTHPRCATPDVQSEISPHR